MKYLSDGSLSVKHHDESMFCPGAISTVRNAAFYEKNGKNFSTYMYFNYTGSSAILNGYPQKPTLPAWPPPRSMFRCGDV